ncbi:DUF3240 family protein [Pseudorhodoferax soli]|uniref:Uncharacterized protein DUF3240 n=1 Tax=Pseudorhodoferax soli TaxID=545864 RepID=A0A368XEI0_9BURK|nr:DUF3240 family protein [Pseudorhodoferax soli]PZP91290.1 MAG: DUF3240 domain-containing protein [Variovorax paradoxus]PZQ01092.1 MAG: DUF3240 domain-containing protein [Variovorax paradoxus]RCW66059.1 uncharacterized protein DUF3240 [Pseudorhodoferax soli]
MPELCLTLCCPQDLEEKLVDALLDVADQRVFTSTAIAAHGASNHRASNAEQVMGRSSWTQVQLLVSSDQLAALLDGLRPSFAGTPLRYWATPLAQAGEF